MMIPITRLPRSLILFGSPKTRPSCWWNKSQCRYKTKGRKTAADAQFVIPLDMTTPDIRVQTPTDAVRFATAVTDAPIEVTGPRLVFYTDASHHTKTKSSGCAYATTAITPLGRTPLKATCFGLQRSTSICAEIVAIGLALEAATQTVAALSIEKWADPSKANWLRLIIFTDSQAAIDLITRFVRNRPTNKISTFKWDTIAALFEPIKKLREQNVFIQVGWVPAHAGVEGNALADNAAKLAMKRTCALQKAVYREVFMLHTEVEIVDMQVGAHQEDEVWEDESDTKKIRKRGKEKTKFKIEKNTEAKAAPLSKKKLAKQNRVKVKSLRKARRRARRKAHRHEKSEERLRKVACLEQEASESNQVTT